MAVGFTSVDSDIRALAAADKPLLLGENVCRGMSQTNWKQGGSWAAGADETDSDYPGTNAYDDFMHLDTRPDASQNTWYWLLDFGAGSSVTFDTAVILGNGTSLNGVQIDFQVADNNAYTTALKTIYTVTPSDNKRVVMLDLDHGIGHEQQYSSVVYARLKFTAGGGCLPSIGEFVLGVRTQLQWKSQVPFDPNNLITDVARFESESGIITDNIRRKKRKKLNLDLPMDESTYITDFESFWEDDLDGGYYPYIYIEDPATTPAAAYWMKETNPELTGPYEVPTVRRFKLNSLEMGPDFYENET